MFRNSRIAIVAAALSLAACGTQQAVVTNGDITKHLEGKGYSKVLVRGKFSCGKAGSGRQFIATKAGKIVTGQVCYLKSGGNVTYAVDELKTPGAANDNRIANPWKSN